MYQMDIFAGDHRFNDGSTLFQGDIVLDYRTRLIIQGGHVRRTRAVKKLANSRWPNGEIPYVVDRDLGKKKMYHRDHNYQTNRSRITPKS